MSTRISLTLALALLATTGIPSVFARVGNESNQSDYRHSMLRKEGSRPQLPLAHEKLVNQAALPVVELPSWNGMKETAIEVPSASHSHKDEN